jgi:WhiB family redox-sensing transcriptional regulator
MGNSPEWMAEASCAGTDGDAFFPEQGDTAEYAKKTCMGCPVQLDCLTYAIDNNIIHGIWGGMNDKQRRIWKHRPRYQRSAA